jgi:hypothetical protein
MTVKELIEFLQTQPQDLLVAYRLHSEQCLLESNYLQIQSFCAPRPDGWVHDSRPDKPQQDYLVFPGN